MNYSRYLSDTRRSPYPRRRKSLAPRSPALGRSLPAITLLSPDGYHLQQSMAPRPLSPGAFQMVPPHFAGHKMSSFVILNETISSPVTSRAPSPSGRVSPFRGHCFKSPQSSRANSRAVSPLPSPTRRRRVIVPSEKTKIVHADIGLPPKSPKRIIKSVQVKEYKPVIKPKPELVNTKPIQKMGKNANVIPNIKVVSGKQPIVMSTVDKNKDKKSPVPPKGTTVQNSKKKNKEPQKGPDAREEEFKEKIANAKDIDVDDPIIVSEVKFERNNQEINEEKKKGEKEERLIPCFQPDKCCIVPPTMASPTQTATSTIAVPSTSTSISVCKVTAPSLSVISSALSVTDALSKKSLPSKLIERPTSGRSTNIEDAKNKLILITSKTPAQVDTALSTFTKLDEVTKSRVSSAASNKSFDQLSEASPTISERTQSSVVTAKAVSNGSLRSKLGESGSNLKTGDSGEVISTTKLIRAGPDVEVLSPNNLLRSPPNAMREHLWEENRMANGESPNATEPKGRCRRFVGALWRLLTYMFCCCKHWTCYRLPNCQLLSCKLSSCCKKSNIPRNPTPQNSCCARCRKCCTCNPCSSLKISFSKINCCKNLKCSSCCKNISCCAKPLCGSCSKCCGKLKCCEGRKCCQKKSQTSKMCCAKPRCNCKDCCVGMKDCCRNCGDGVNSFCRTLFCLNLSCCQRCLKKCTCCHKLKCCQKGGCCSCCNPHVKREQRAKLDKKTSRASNQSKQERAKLDSALVDHTSMMKAAIPVLPQCLAWFCLFLNIIIPGSGTLVSGILCLCFGRPRFSVNDTPQNRMSSFLLNVVIAVGQAFTIIFCLVGWGWSIWWGVILVKLARKQKRLKLAGKSQDGLPTTISSNHVDPEKR